jgi:hypothetical protein
MSDPQLIPAEIMARCVPPPKREDMYILIGVWRGWWAMPSSERGAWTEPNSPSLLSAIHRLESNGWTDITVVKIPGNQRSQP